MQALLICELRDSHGRPTLRELGSQHDPVTGDFATTRGESRISDSALRALAGTPGQEVTFLAATPVSGNRVAFGSAATAVPRLR